MQKAHRGTACVCRATARSAEIERFKADPKCNVFLISIKAGGLGLNLTEADRVVIMEPG